MVNRDIPLRSVPIFSRTNGCRLEFEQSIFYLFPAGQQGYRYSIRSNTVRISRHAHRCSICIAWSQFF